MIYRPARALPRRGTLLFVHGLCHGAWCWDQGFMECCSDEGYDCHALELNRGRPLGRQTASIGSYVEQLRVAVESLPAAPVLIGHSMGGFVVQKYIEQYPCDRVVLMASVPPNGALLPALRFLQRHPDQLLNLLRGDIRRALATHYSELFSADMDGHRLKSLQAQLVSESFRAFVELCFGRVRLRGHFNAEVLVLGGEEDRLIGQKEVIRTANLYGRNATIIEQHGHNMMLENNQERLAEIILHWLQS